MRMAIPASIQRRGVRKWYERELLIGHSHLVLLLLSVVTIFGAMEAFSTPGGAKALMVACVLVACAIGLWALRRYLFLLTRAEFIANQAVCGQCKAYGRWAVESSREPAGARADAADGSYMVVCCKRCGGRWQIDW
jgi:hypothetical protein